MKKNEIVISNKKVGHNNAVFIVGELSGNHNGDINLAKKTISAIKGAGADAVKLQTYKPESLCINVDKPWFMTNSKGIWAGRSMYDLYKEASTPYEWHAELFDYAKKLGLICFSSPFDYEAIDLLDSLDTPAYKVASFEIQDTPLIRAMAKHKKPMIISTGIATFDDIQTAIEVCHEESNDQIILLKCTSAYPTPTTEVNLNLIPQMAKDFNVVVGLSDHTMGTTVPIAAVAIGAKIIEKHVILDRSLGGVDSTFSLEPEELKQLVDSVRTVEEAMGTASYELTKTALDSRKRGRSLFASDDIKKGDIITEKNIVSVRPGLGLPPSLYSSLIGKVATQDIEKGTPLSVDMINFPIGT